MASSFRTRLVLDHPAVVAMLRAESGPVGVDLQRRLVRVTSAAKRLCPVDTGRLRSSIRWSMTKDSRGLVGIVGSDVDYALFVHEGTRPHRIESKGPWPLRNPRTGQVFGRVVQHPGTKGQPFLLKALQEAR